MITILCLRDSLTRIGDFLSHSTKTPDITYETFNVRNTPHYRGILGH